MIEVRLFATLRENRGKILYLEPFNTIEDLINHLNIPAEEVAICLVNGFHSNLDKKIKDKDIIAIFPPVGGG